MESLRRFAMDAGLATVVRLLNALLLIGVGAILARNVGPAEFAEGLLYLSAINIVSAIAAGGLHSVAIREILNCQNTAEKRGLVRQLYAGALAICSVILAVGTIFALGIAVFEPTSNELAWIALATSVAGVAGGFRQVAAGILRGDGRFVSASFMDGFVGNSVVVAALLLSERASEHFLAVVVLSWVANAAVALFRVRRYGFAVRGVRASAIKDLLRGTVPLVVPTVCGNIISHLPLYLMGLLQMTDLMPMVAASVQLSQGLSVVFAGAQVALLRFFAEMAAKGKQAQFRAAIPSVSLLWGLATMFVACAAWVFGGWAMKVIYGEGLLYIGSVFAFILAGRWGTVAPGPAHAILIVFRRERLFGLISGLGAFTVAGLMLCGGWAFGVWALLRLYAIGLIILGLATVGGAAWEARKCFREDRVYA